MRVLLFSIALFTVSCQSKTYEYELGGVGAFAEMVNAGVKTLALSAPLPPDEMDAFIDEATRIAEKNGCNVFRESDLIVTSLFPENVAEGKDVLLIYKGNTLEAYQQLKRDQQLHIENGEYGPLVQIDISRRFGRMLSYTPEKINSLLAQNTDFRTMKDFGIAASNVFLYYRDLPRAVDFYTSVLGLELIADYGMATILRVASDYYIVLVDADEGMHSADEPKSVALAFLTDELPAWYRRMQEYNVPVRYPYTPRTNNAHDGFVVIDPEGYLLEFEQFKQHPENELFMPVASGLSRIETSNGLHFYGGVTWVYHKDLLAMQHFYQETLGLSLVIDQGWTKVYQLSEAGFIGLVDEKRGMRSFSEDKGVTLSFWLDDIDGWFEYVQRNNLFPLRSDSISTGPEGKYRAFVGYGPEGYFLEFDHFYEHTSNTRLLELLQ